LKPLTRPSQLSSTPMHDVLLFYIISHGSFRDRQLDRLFSISRKERCA
jgi:hypothetical protein